MLSAAPAIEPQIEPISQVIADPASPIHHETAVVEAAPEPTLAIQHLGTGALEEEELVDEEELPTLHASSIEEIDDLDEEETLEGAADLGTMIREMSIDEITASRRCRRR